VSQSAFAVVLAAIFGLVIGSFLNVVIWRVPRGESVVRPASHCPNCDREIRGRDNIPVLSWLVLRGKCRDCGSPISARYPAVEALTAAIFVLLALRFGWDLQLIAFCYLAAIGIALSAIDFDTRRLPDVIVLPSYGVGLVLLLLPAVFDHKWHNLITGVLGGAVRVLFRHLVHLSARDGIWGRETGRSARLVLGLVGLGDADCGRLPRFSGRRSGWRAAHCLESGGPTIGHSFWASDVCRNFAWGPARTFAVPLVSVDSGRLNYSTLKVGRESADHLPVGSTGWMPEG
jgi:leader peptidase (prepilin peptidase)/N-methyltransferase